MDHRDIIVLWLVLTSAAYLVFQFAPVRLPSKHSLWLIWAVGIAVHAVPFFVNDSPIGLAAVDISNFREAGQKILDRRDLYTFSSFISPHPYPPFHAYVFAAAIKLTDLTPLTFFQVMRLPTMAADTGIALIIYLAVRRLQADPDAALRDGLAFAVCPFSLLVSSIHGQFDAVSVFFAVSSLYVLLAWDRTPGNMLLSGALLGCGIAEKVWPLVLLPVLLWYLRREIVSAMYLAGAAVAVPIWAMLVYVAIFPSRFGRIINTIRDYAAPPNIDGYTFVFSRIGEHAAWGNDAADWANRHGNLILGASLVAVGAIVIPKLPVLQAALTVVLTFLVATTDGGLYHTLWVVPLAFLAGQRLWVAALLVPLTLDIYVIMMVGCGVYCGTGQLDQWLQDRGEWFVMAVWFIELAWLLWNVAQALGLSSPAARPTPSGAAQTA